MPIIILFHVQNNSSAFLKLVLIYILNLFNIIYYVYLSCFFVKVIVFCFNFFLFHFESAQAKF